MSATTVTEQGRYYGKPNTMTEPNWATLTIQEACKQYNRRPPKMQWRKSSWRNHGTSYTSRKMIVMSVTSDSDSNKSLLLHELAHYFDKSRKAGHNKRFWMILKKLLIQFNEYSEENRRSEYLYMKRSQNYL